MLRFDEAYSGSLQQSFNYEDGSHEGDEDVLGELGVVSDDDGSLESGQEQGYDGAPDGDPDPDGHELDLRVLGELVQGFVEDHHGASDTCV